MLGQIFVHAMQKDNMYDVSNSLYTHLEVHLSISRHVCVCVYTCESMYSRCVDVYNPGWKVTLGIELYNNQEVVASCWLLSVLSITVLSIDHSAAYFLYFQTFINDSQPIGGNKPKQPLLNH